MAVNMLAVPREEVGVLKCLLRSSFPQLEPELTNESTMNKAQEGRTLSKGKQDGVTRTRKQSRWGPGASRWSPQTSALLNRAFRLGCVPPGSAQLAAGIREL